MCGRCWEYDHVWTIDPWDTAYDICVCGCGCTAEEYAGPAWVI